MKHFKDDNGKQYSLEYRHVKAKLDPRQKKPYELHPKHAVKAITTCVVASENFIAIENAICLITDTFSRAEGCRRALARLMQRNAALLLPIRAQLSEEWSRLDYKTIQSSVRGSLSQAMIAELKAEGLDRDDVIRRRQARKQARARAAR